ncbi:xanthine dehydrogenase family protein molybdopterin-binding subunit [Glacieibacterium megasporae]|uniref:xanthine dehydrogenase family protein molybdopterin-binding subunit n=1 Tax=Glacieibacterium megasporae TaxID=2835787 RepID=UPI001C1E8AE1|nr:xanthine dehydrogenase family protein molybdopterin-binding subunit [Polymorphobacter megasporae]UAJ10559.1 xanthine dehydrogenase family protein molybdopterin-binding subunit [Polymorphobacter megasporae]
MTLTGRALELFHLGEGPPDQLKRFDTIGLDLPRVDGLAKVTGAATYAAEWPVEGLVHGAVVDSAIARGIIKSIDVSAALATPGVLAVVTHDNAPRLAGYPEKGAGFPLTGEGGLGEVRQPLQASEIHYGSQSIAVVIAKSAEQARFAASLVTVDYVAEVPETDMDRASRTTKPEAFSGGEPLQRDGASVEAAFERAPVRMVREYRNPVYYHNPIEILASIASWEKRDGVDHLMLYDTTRSVDMLRDVVCHSFGLPKAQVQIVSKFIGGAFGSKAWTFHNPLLVALAAKVVGRPLRLEWRRQQIYSIGGHRPAQRHIMRIGAQADGRMLALHHWTRQHSSMVSGYTEYGSRMTKMMYAVPELGFTNELAHLNLPSPSVMRGPGFLTGGWALETVLDELACELDIDPIELRLRNHADIDPDSGLPFSNKHLLDCYARGAERFGWDARPAKPGERHAGRDLVGYGMASAMHPAAQQEASAEVTLHADGTASAKSATHEIGNGAYTVFRQIAADGVALPMEKVTFDLGDTNFPAAPPTHGSLTTATVGPAVLDAATDAVEKLKLIAGNDKASPLYHVKPARIAAGVGRLHLVDDVAVGEDYATILVRAGLTKVTGKADVKPGLERMRYAFYSFGAVFAEVRVDPQTGVVRVARLCGVYDCGRLINPRTARSQLMGGMIFALGATLTEEAVFDPVNGLPVVRNFADYHVPSFGDAPEITIEVLNIIDPHVGELGAHGVGELGTSGVPAAIGNAIFNACGVRLRSLPYTPDKLIEAKLYG